MTNQIFEVSVCSSDIEGNAVQDVFRIFGLENAVQQGIEFGACDNVESVDVVDATTGEVVVEVEKNEVVWLAIEE